MVKSQMFSIGHVESPQSDDRRFDTRADADTAAVESSYDDSVWAVWADDGEIVSLVYQQQVFTA